MPKAFAKPSPKLWLVPDWSAFPSCIKDSMGIGCLSTCEFFFICLLSANDRDRKGNPRRNLHRGLTSGSFSPELPLLSHVRCGLPAIRTLWSGGTVLSSSPILLRNTTDCIPSEGHGRSGCLSGRNRRTGSLGCRADAETLLKRLKASLSYPCNLRRKTFYMVFLFIK